MINRLLRLGLCATLFSLCPAVFAGTPLFTFEALDNPSQTLPVNDTATIRYRVTNQSSKPHIFSLQSTPGVSGVFSGGSCPSVAGKGNCLLTLTITGSELAGNLTDGPIVCEANTGALQCYRPSSGDLLNIVLGPAEHDTTLRICTDGASCSTTALTSSLYLSVTGLENIPNSGFAHENAGGGLNNTSGTARRVIIKNTGSAPATNVAAMLQAGGQALPTGASLSHNCSASLAAGATCEVTVTPAATASSDGTNACTASGAVPIASPIEIKGDNTNTVTSNVSILSYGCIVGEGFLFAVTEPSDVYTSIRGKVVALEDQKPILPNGVVWSSNGVGGAEVSYDTIPGISEASITSASNPTYSNSQSTFNSTYNNTNTHPFPAPSSFSSCDGKIDGACNTANIVVLYQSYKTNYGVGDTSAYSLSTGPTDKDFYAAGVCNAYVSGNYQDWYLPAICEMGVQGSSGFDAGCGTNYQNIQTLLNPLLIGDPVNNPGTSCAHSINCLSGVYWSATEASGSAQGAAWIQFFAQSASFQANDASKSGQLGVRCARVFNP